MLWACADDHGLFSEFGKGWFFSLAEGERWEGGDETRDCERRVSGESVDGQGRRVISPIWRFGLKIERG